MFLPYIVVSIVLLAAIAFGNFPKRASQTLLFLTAALPIVYFYYTILSQASHAAFIDDFNLLDSFQRMLFSDSPGERAGALFEQVNEHRFPFERLVMYGIYLLTGTPSPFFQIMVGNLFMLGIAWLLYRVFQSAQQPAAYFLPVILILFNLLYYENAYWAIAAVQNTPLIFFAMLSAYALGKQSKGGDVLAVLAALTTTFVSGSGVAVWVLGAIILVFQRRHRFLLVWLGAAAATLTLYFSFDYTLHQRSRAGLLTHPFLNTGVFLGFLGSLFSEGFLYGTRDHFTVRTFAAVTAGVLPFVVSLWWLLMFWLNKDQKKVFPYSLLSGVFLFVMASAAMLVISRPSQASSLVIPHYISSRYVIFSAVLWGGTYLALLFVLRNHPKTSRAIFILFLFVNAAVHYASYFSFIPTLVNHKATLELDKLYIDEHDGRLLSFNATYNDRLFWNHPTAFKNLIRDLEKNELYKPRKQPEAALLSRIRGIDKEPDLPVSTGAISSESKPSSGFNNRPNARVTLRVTFSDCTEARPAYFVLQSPEAQFILPAVADRADLTEMAQTLSFSRCSYSYSFSALQFPAYSYDVFLVNKGRNDQFTIEKAATGFRLSHQF